MLVLTVAAVCAPGVSAAQERAAPWTEVTVLERARANAPELAVARAEVEREEALALAAGLAENPTLSWEREHILGSAARTHDIVALSVPIDVSGRRAARAGMARAGAALARTDAERDRAEVLARAVLAFHEAVAAERRVALLEAARLAIGEAARVMGRREEAGEAAGYERLRLELEEDLAESHVAEARSAARLARMALAAAAEPALREVPAVDGSLATRDPGPLEPLLARARARRRDLAAAGRADALARAAVDDAGRAWLPTLTLSGGWNVEAASRTEHGYVAGAALDIPLFDRGQDVGREADATRALATARAAAARARVDAEVRIAHARLTAARTELARFQQRTSGRTEGLRRAVASAYAEGVRTLVELLDAERALLEVALRALDLELEAKRAEIALRAASGDLR